MRNIDLTKGTGTFKGKAKDNALQTSATLFKPQSSIPNNAVPQSKEASSAEPAVSAEACSDNMSLLSLKDPAKTSHATQNMQLTAQDPLSKSSTGELIVLFVFSKAYLFVLCTIHFNIFAAYIYTSSNLFVNALCFQLLGDLMYVLLQKHFAL